MKATAKRVNVLTSQAPCGGMATLSSQEQPGILLQICCRLAGGDLNEQKLERLLNPSTHFSVKIEMFTPPADRVLPLSPTLAGMYSSTNRLNVLFNASVRAVKRNRLRTLAAQIDRELIP
jgi:hypothetical protein